MNCNMPMKNLFIQIEQFPEIEALVDLRELEKLLTPNIYLEKNYLGEIYICVNDFCGLNNSVPTMRTANALTDLEWDGNEVYICLGEAGTVLILAQIIVMVINSWKYILSVQFPKLNIDIVASINDGTLDEVYPSATVRLYSIRNGYHVMNTVDGFELPVCIESITPAL